MSLQQIPPYFTVSLSQLPARSSLPKTSSYRMKAQSPPLHLPKAKHRSAHPSSTSLPCPCHKIHPRNFSLMGLTGRGEKLYFFSNCILIDVRPWQCGWASQFCFVFSMHNPTNSRKGFGILQFENHKNKFKKKSSGTRKII